MPLETINLSNKNSQDGDKFVPTPEELRTIHEKMKDPKFVELFADYMKSMEDPETRREEEEYLRQVENEAKAGGDYSFDFIFPTPGFVVELLEPSTTYKVTRRSKKTEDKKKKENPSVFVNMCSSEKIEPFSEQSTGDKERANWLVPVSVSKPRTELFSEGITTSVKSEKEKESQANEDEANPVVVYDAVFHPNTLQLADRSDRFCCFLVNIAVEHINSGYGDRHGFEFRRLSSRIQSVGTPQNQTIQREKGKSPFAAAMNEPVLTQPTKVLPPLPTTAEGNGKSTNGDKKEEKVTNSDKKEKKEHLPQCTILHRGNIDLSDTWGWKIVDRRIGVPETLVVKMEFTGVQSASQLNVEVESTYINISKSSSYPYYGTLTLPFSVESTPLEAKFEKRKALLTLVLRVLPPEPTGITAEDMRQEMSAPIDTVDSEVKDNKGVNSEVTNIAAEETVTEECVQNDTTSPVPAAVPKEKETESVPQVSCIGDQDRVRLMMEKVQAARREREKAAAEAKESVETCVPEKTAENVSEQKENENSVKEVSKDTEEEKPRQETETVPAAVLEDKTPNPLPTDTEDGDKSAKEDAELELLRQRQDAWKTDMQRRIEAKKEEEEEESREKSAAAEREARREAERLRKRVEAAKQQEELAVKLGERMTELPLRNKHIFTVD